MNITYEDKVALIENEDIPDINKCNASDMNQIKEVVNSKANVIKLLTVNDVAPVNCETGDKYYNTADEVIYTAVGTNEWGTDGKLPIQGYVYLDVENSKLYCYDGTIFSSYGGGTSNEIVISEEQPTTEDWKIWIDTNEVNNLGSEVVDSLDGNETNKAPSVRAVKEELNVYSTEEQVIGTWLDKTLYRKVYQVDSLPNTSSKTISSNLTNISVKNIYGYFENSGVNMMPFNISNPSSLTNSVQLFYEYPTNVIKIETGKDRSSYSGYVVLEYTKTTDTPVSTLSEVTE